MTTEESNEARRQQDVQDASNSRENINRGLGRVEGKIDFLISSFASHAQEDKTNFSILDKRMEATEKKINWMLGVGSGVMSLIGMIYAYLHK